MSKEIMSNSNVLDPEKICWYVMRAYRKENLAEIRMKEFGSIEYYIPKHFITQNNHGKKISRLVPVIPSIVFVHASRTDILQLKIKCDFLQFAMWKTAEGPMFLTVPEKEMDNFIKVTSSINEQIRYYKPGEVNLKKGTKVRIIGGTFDGAEGVYLRPVGRRSKQFMVEIPDVLAASVEVDPDLIQVL